MDLRPTAEHDLLRETVRQMMSRYSPPEAVRALETDELGYRPELWQELARADLLGLVVDEAYGGAGQTLVEAVIVAEEMGRALSASPYVVTAVLTPALLRAATEEQRRAWLPRVVGGEAVLSFAWLEPDRRDEPDVVTTTLDGGRLTGEKILVPFAAAATAVVVLARAPEGPTLAVVDPRGDGVAVERQPTLATDASYRVALAGAPVIETWSAPGAGAAAFEAASVDLLITVAAFAAGGARAALEMAVAYAKERVQFDRPIGSFQGLAHPIAEAAMEVEGAAVLVRRAAWARATGRDAAPLAAMAKLYACDVFRRATKVGQQVFGGIGFTTDIDMQLYFRRAKQLELTWFGPRALEERIAAAELDAPVPFVTAGAGE